MDLSDLADNLRTKKDFEQFLFHLIKDLKENRAGWDNDNLDTFLDAMHGFTCDIEGYYKNQKIVIDTSKPTWSMIANILLAAKGYE